MTTQTEPFEVGSLSHVTARQWTGAVVGGLVGSVLFGLVMTFVIPAPLLEVVIPAMYGVAGPSPVVGWLLHLFHGTVIALAYVALVVGSGLGSTARSLAGATALGVGYGLLTTVGLAVLVMPLWLAAVGFPNAPPFPNVAVPATLVTTVGHVVYAVPVALGYALVTESGA